jgi:GTP-binding protein Era
MHQPRTRLGDYMVKTTESAIGEVDAVILVVEARDSVGDIEAKLIKQLRAQHLPAILVINKTDAVNAEHIAKTIAAYAEAFDFDAVVPLSAKNGKRKM